MIYLNLFIVIFFGSFFLILYLATRSRLKTQEKIRKILPEDRDFYAPVRFNSERANDRIIKLKSFECSGIMSAKDNLLFFKGSKNKYDFTFDLKKVKLLWIGTQLQNGFLEWFMIEDEGKQKYYFNIETGVFVFKLANDGGFTTQTLYYRISEIQKNLGA